jgi:histidyl-tRNA synthetase
MEGIKSFSCTGFSTTKILFFNLGEKESHCAFEIAEQMRSRNIACEVYHELAKV